MMEGKTGQLLVAILFSKYRHTEVQSSPPTFYFSFVEIQSLQMQIKVLIYAGETCGKAVKMRDRHYLAKLRHLASILRMMSDMKKKSRTLTLFNRCTSLVLNVPEYIILSFQVNYSKVLLVKNPLKNPKPSYCSLYGILLFATQLLFS